VGMGLGIYYNERGIKGAPPGFGGGGGGGLWGLYLSFDVPSSTMAWIVVLTALNLHPAYCFICHNCQRVLYSIPPGSQMIVIQLHYYLTLHKNRCTRM